MKPSKLKRRWRRRCTHAHLTQRFLNYHAANGTGKIIRWRGSLALRVEDNHSIYLFPIIN